MSVSDAPEHLRITVQVSLHSAWRSTAHRPKKYMVQVQSLNHLQWSIAKSSGTFSAELSAHLNQPSAHVISPFVSTDPDTP